MTPKVQTQRMKWAAAFELAKIKASDAGDRLSAATRPDQPSDSSQSAAGRRGANAGARRRDSWSGEVTEHPEKPPFSEHKRYYMMLKLIVLVAAVVLAIRYLVFG